MKVYPAGPDVFYVDALARFAEMKQKCQDHGVEGLSPFDNNFQVSEHPGLEDALTIFRLNRKMIEEADAVIANLTPFRGVSADPGTVWEVGYAMGNDKPVFAYSQDDDQYVHRVMNYSKTGMIQRDANGLLILDDMLVEPFGLRDNLMLEGGLIEQRAMPGVVLLNSFDMAPDELVRRFKR